MAKAASKRKSETPSQISRKKAKTTHLAAGELPWKVIATPKEAGLGNDFDGILELEEVDGIEVVYEETVGGKVPRFKVSNFWTFCEGLH